MTENHLIKNHVKHNASITQEEQLKYQQEWMIKNVRNCTQTAVSHISAKLNPSTPQLELLHNLCLEFLTKKASSVFELVKENKGEKEKGLAPITDLGITFQGKSPEIIPPDYELLKYSVGGEAGDLQRHGAKSPYFFFRRSWKEKAITALALISPDSGEEPPLGFEMIRQTPGAKDANLCARMNAPSLFLCIHRGEGPAIVNIGVVHVKKEQIPWNYHVISSTFTGRTPPLDMGRTLIVYQRDYKAVIYRFAKFGENGNEEDMLLAGCFACLVAGIYSYDRHVFLITLEAFTALNNIKNFPKGMLADFVTLVRDAVTAYISVAFFKNEVYVKVLKWLSHVYITRAQELDTRAFMSMIHLSMILRHDDVRENTANSILTAVLKQSKNTRRMSQKFSNHTYVNCENTHEETVSNHSNTIISMTANSDTYSTEQTEISLSSISAMLQKKKQIKEERENTTKEIQIQSPTIVTPNIEIKNRLNTISTIEEDMHNVVLDIVDHICIVKSIEPQAIRFLNCKVIDQEFHEWMSQFIDSWFENHFDRFTIAAAILLAKISAQTLPIRLTPRSETIKRRIHALNLLTFFLEESQSFFKKNATALVILRRIIFTSFLHSAIVHVPVVFQTMFRLYEIFWHSYRNWLKFEIGVLLSTGMVGLLSSSFCTTPQKVDLLNGLTQMFVNKSALIDIFYNYDNDTINWPVCQNLVDTIAKLIDAKSSQANCNVRKKQDRIGQGALRLLARFMELMAKYLKAPNLNKGGNLNEQEDFDMLGMGHVPSDIQYSFVTDDAENEDMESESPFKQTPGIDFSRRKSNINLRDLATLHPKQDQENKDEKEDITASVSSFGDEIITVSSALGFQDPLNSLSSVSITSPEALAPILSNVNTPIWSQSDKCDKVNKDKFIVPTTIKEINGNVQKKFSDLGSSITLHDDDKSQSQPEKEEHKNEIDWNNIQGRECRSDTWQLRYAGHKEEQKIVEEALKRARQGKLKNGIEFLISQGGKFADLKFIAQFLYSNDTLDPTEVGDFISNLESSALSETRHHDLLLTYVGLLNFTGMQFDAAFRHFLIDCGFRLPLESQKIERLMFAFAWAFTRDNPQVFSSHEQCFVLAYAVLILNTELHNPNAARANLDGPMTQLQFSKLLPNDKYFFPPDLIHDLYQSIKDNPIEIKNFNSEANKGMKDIQLIQKQFRNECSGLVQRAQAHLRELATRKHSWQKAPNVRIVRALYDVTWHQFLVAITSILAKEKDPQIQSECLEAIKYSCAAAIVLGLVKPELHAFASHLAKFVYIEENKHLKPQAIHLATVTGEHLKQKWFLTLLEISARAPNVACGIVSRICNDMQRRVIYDTDQKILRDIEALLSNELFLVHPERRFIKSGILTKQSLKGDLVFYKFYLFNDILFYALENHSTLTVHRVLHLSLCRVVDLKDGFVNGIKNAFRILSPQKAIVLIAETPHEKKEWMYAIENSIAEQIEFRARWINENYKIFQDVHPTSQISQFIGRTVGPKRHELKRVQAGEQNINSKDINPDVKSEIAVFQRQSPCKLCIRPFKRFATKTKCIWCQQMVCNECLQHKVKVQNTKKLANICDGCFGALYYYMSDTTHKDVDFSQAEVYLPLLPKDK